MRQRRWIELFSDYECEIRYHPGKANVVTDALSRKERVKPRRVRAMAMTIQTRVKEIILQPRVRRDVRMVILNEAHKSRYYVHLRADKMYYDLCDMYWWPGMKRDIVIYVSKCLTYAKVKAEHQRPSCLQQQPEITEWKWDKITMDLIIKLPRKCRLSVLWAVIKEGSLIGPELVLEMTDKVVLDMSKMDKIKSKMDKTKHGNEKSVKR
nr:putative reverse transcriptase domain-containing protein [Tanacetum cinerariifolium]